MKNPFTTQFPTLWYWYLCTRWFIEDIPENLLIKSRVRLILYLISLITWALPFFLLVSYPIIKLSLQAQALATPATKIALKFAIREELTSLFCHIVPAIGLFILLESFLYHKIRRTEPVQIFTMLEILNREHPCKILGRQKRSEQEYKWERPFYVQLGEMTNAKKGNIQNIYLLSLTLVLLYLATNLFPI